MAVCERRAGVLCITETTVIIIVYVYKLILLLYTALAHIPPYK